MEGNQLLTDVKVYTITVFNGNILPLKTVYTVPNN